MYTNILTTQHVAQTTTTDKGVTPTNVGYKGGPTCAPLQDLADLELGDTPYARTQVWAHSHGENPPGFEGEAQDTPHQKR